MHSHIVLITYVCAYASEAQQANQAAVILFSTERASAESRSEEVARKSRAQIASLREELATARRLIQRSDQIKSDQTKDFHGKEKHEPVSFHFISWRGF